MGTQERGSRSDPRREPRGSIWLPKVGGRSVTLNSPAGIRWADAISRPALKRGLENRLAPLGYASQRLEIIRGRRCDFAVFHLEHEQKVWHGAVCGRLRTVVIDLDIRHVRHEFDEVQLRQRVALADFLFWNRTAT